MSEKISLRISEEDMNQIDSFIETQDYSNRSAFLRDAAIEYMNRHSIQKDKSEIPAKVNVPTNIKNGIHYLIVLGYFDSWETAIGKLIKDAFLELNLREIKEKYDEIDRVSNQVERSIEVQKERKQQFLKK